MKLDALEKYKKPKANAHPIYHDWKNFWDYAQAPYHGNLLIASFNENQLVALTAKH